MNYLERDNFGMYRSMGDSNAIDNGNNNGNTPHGPGPSLMGANTLDGNDVYNRKGDDLGDIKEIMIDMRSGRVSYAVLSYGGFLGMGDKLFAVPWSALTLDTVNKRFTLDVDKDRLEHAPGFNKEQWPNMADPAWAKGVHEFYGVETAHESAM